MIVYLPFPGSHSSSLLVPVRKQEGIIIGKIYDWMSFPPIGAAVLANSKISLGAL